MTPAKTDKRAHIVCVMGCYYATCAEGISEALVTLASGRDVRFPKLGKNARRSDIALNTWLRTEAITEAQNANDAHCLAVFTNMNPKNMPPASLDDLNDYLFDPQLPREANGELLITAPRVAVLAEGGRE